jgi:hypothetical protein
MNEGWKFSLSESLRGVHGVSLWGSLAWIVEIERVRSEMLEMLE